MAIPQTPNISYWIASTDDTHPYRELFHPARLAPKGRLKNFSLFEMFDHGVPNFLGGRRATQIRCANAPRQQ